MMVRLHLRIEGRVQGVFYRASAAEEAQRLGLVGWVRNRLDGSVELVAEGEETALNALAQWCTEGPPLAQVSRVESVWETAVGLREVLVRPTT